MTTDNNPKAGVTKPKQLAESISLADQIAHIEFCAERAKDIGYAEQAMELAILNSLRSLSPSAVSEGDAWRYCWLIERQIDQRAAWRSMTSFLPCAGWTLDANEALWFARQKDAEDFMRADDGDGEIYSADAVEHGFTNTDPLSPTNIAREK